MRKKYKPKHRQPICYAIYARQPTDTVADFPSCEAQFTVCSDVARQTAEPGLTWCG